MNEIKSENLSKEIKQLSLREILFKYVKYIPLYLIFIFLGLLCSWLYLRYTQEQYSAKSSIILNLNQGSSNNREDKVEDILNSSSQLRSVTGEIEILTSKPLVDRVVKALDLQYTYTAIGKIKNENVYGKCPFVLNPLILNDSAVGFLLNIHFIDQNIFKVNGSGSFKFGEVFKTDFGSFQLSKEVSPSADAEYAVSYAPTKNVVNSIASNINVAPKADAKSGIIDIGYQTNNPELATDIVNTLIEEYNKMSIENNNVSMDQTLNFTETSMVRLNNEVDSIRNLLIAFQKKNQVVDARSEVEDFVQESRAQRELVLGRQMGLMTLSQIENELSSNSNSGKLSVPSSLGIDDITLNQLIKSYNELQIEKASLIQSNVPETNPRIEQIDENIKGLRSRVIENVRSLKSNFQKTLGYVNSQSNSDKGKALSTAPIVREQMEFERQLQQKLDILSLFERRRIEILMSKVGVISNSKIINRAEVNKAPVAPNRSVVRLSAILISLLIPTIFIFIKELLNDKINTRADIERNTATPILGEIGHSQEENTLVVDKTKRTLIAEQFRILRSNLHFILGNKQSATILVTSSFGGEGKSFISTNISAVLALTDKKTIVLEFDLRKPRVLSGLNLDKKPGVSNFMVGDMQLDQLILPIPGVNNLYVLPCGPIPPNPAELLLSDKVEQLFAELKKKFDYIIIDTAPVGMVSDGLTLGKFADATLYVSRQNYTFKKQVNLIDELYTQKKLPNMSIVLNDVQEPTGGGYYGNYGSSYGYGYGYGEKDGYFIETKKKKSSAVKSILKSMNPIYWFKN